MNAGAPAHRNGYSPRRSYPFALVFIFGVLAAAAVFAIYQNFFRKIEPKVVLAAKVSPFSGLPGREDMPAFSPDGKQIVFVWNGGEGDNSDVYVKFIGTGEPVRLTNTASDELYPVFSPDARHIAFVRVLPTGEEVILIPAIGGPERKICELNSGRASISFSPDGKYLAVVDRDASVGSLVIFLFDRQTGERRRLTGSNDLIIENTPRFSPDGKSIAFLHYINDAVQELFVISAAGGAARQLTFDRAQIRSLAWSADGERIIFASLRQNNQPNLWQIQTKEGAAPELISTNGKNIKYTAASPDGKTLAFVEESENIDIRQITPGEKTARKFIESTGTDVDPQFSPDGAHVLFASERAGIGEIWISDANGKNPRQLTDSAVSAGSPRFSPDGRSIAYGSQDEKIYIISAEGGAPRRLTENEAAGVLPAWSADGRDIYFASNRTGDQQLWKMPASGGNAVQITKGGAYEAFAAPGGKWIYYSKGKGSVGLWRVQADGGEEMPVPELADAGFWRSWTVTPAGIYYVAYARQPPYRIIFYDFAEGRTREIAVTEKPPLPYSSGLSVSPDGKTILYAQQDQSAGSILLAEFGK
jgi:Tol biopolymer transport system component